MNLAEIRDGARVFVDTNILIYARRGVSLQCRAFLNRCQNKAVRGVVTSYVVAEFCHRRMMQEAQSSGLVASNPARALSAKPELVRNLTVYAEDTRALLNGELELAAIHHHDFIEALLLQTKHGLLTIDSINLAVAHRLGLSEVVTADMAFDNVQGVSVYRPNDLQTQ
jgi:predicted nucleic acid-binding protein